MKRLIPILLLSFITLSIYAQKIEFSAYGLKNSYSNGSVILAHAALKIEKLTTGEYKIIAMDPRNNSIACSLKIKFKDFNDNTYEYTGFVNFGSQDETCSVFTIINLKNFLTGAGNESTFVYNVKNEIQVSYGDDESFSLYPILDKAFKN